MAPLKNPVILFFTEGSNPTDAEMRQAETLAGTVKFRNARFAADDTSLEKCDFVAGAVPDKYGAIDRATATFQRRKDKPADPAADTGAKAAKPSGVDAPKTGVSLAKDHSDPDDNASDTNTDANRGTRGEDRASGSSVGTEVDPGTVTSDADSGEGGTNEAPEGEGSAWGEGAAPAPATAPKGATALKPGAKPAGKAPAKPGEPEWKENT